MKKIISGLALLTAAAWLSGCSRSDSRETVLKTYPLDDMAGLLSETGAEIDKQVSSQGTGSLKVTTQGPTTIRLFETGPLEVDNAVLVFKAKLRSQNLEGQAYLEMLCDLAGKGEFFSRGLDNTISGTTNWASAQTPFLLEKGQKPENIKLNLVIKGKGTVWIDDIKLVKLPAK